jgi:regulator of replication initiation timing
LTETSSGASASQAAGTSQHALLIEELNAVKRENETLKGRLDKTEQENAQLKRDLDNATTKLSKMNDERRMLLNQVFDLRGNVRVFVRERPSIASDASGQRCIWNFPSESSLELESSAGGSSRKLYLFDQVFAPQSSQQQLFDAVAPLIQSAMDGYNVYFRVW